MTPTRILPDLQCSLMCEEIRQEANGNFMLIGVINFIRVPQLPVVAFKLVEGTKFTVFDISALLRSFGWQVPAYTMPDNAADVAVLRIVVREGFSANMARALRDDLVKVLDKLDRVGIGGVFDEAHFAH